MLRQPTVTPRRLCPGRAEVCARVVLYCSRDIGVDLRDRQRIAQVTPPFSLTLLAVTSRMSSTVRDFTFLNYGCNPRANRSMKQGTLGGIRP